MRHVPQPAREDLDLPAVLHALGDPVRFELVRRMASGGEVACSPDDLDVPRSTLSNHWRILREAGLTVTRPEGKARCMSLRRDDLDARFPGLVDTLFGRAGEPV
ncbi:ArsR/SmtB family transcription factor [Streptosporangium sp. CA-135522]|uniref:ArsR/SmtB family transcription factor n=1 Tax=Streptosporangium sp. CA-135522 TaxID=3240072 RepID=UPI003D913849